MKRIAVVEDNADNRLLLRAILAGDYELEESVSGPAALESFAQRAPDLVLLDISLPGLDGTAVLQRMQAAEALRTVPVIALTAHAMAGDRERFLDLGFADYLSKPIVDEERLRTAIRRQLGDA